ncbi:hypothetical protein VS_II0173 [Vibrio atlanticus]|uniref:Uncharacterized protein n=1 Tax=Vibrio atlanticus (strain LGP32) TaxID=575788 RepID=B7VQE3_VIBA3|nr:hypothetical protein VS_II0173 [Vibrio atlanticus]
MGKDAARLVGKSRHKLIDKIDK